MITKNIKQLIKEYFFNYPTAKIRVRQLERTLKLPLPSIIRYCKDLEQEGIIITQTIGNVNFYTASKNETYNLEKRLYNIKTLYDSGVINQIKKQLSNPVIVLFGSYSRGEDTEESDIDIYLETTDKKQLIIKNTPLSGKIQVFKYKSIKAIPNPHLRNSIINGIVLNKQLEVF